MITLVIVDVQNDFISGTLRIEGARSILEPIKQFIKKNQSNIDKIIFTVDWHPYNHCSFKENGGKWPQHCVQFTPGACIEPKLLKFVQALKIKYSVSTKGELEYYEQYGAFDDIEYVQDGALINRYYFDSVVEADADTDFVVCGIAGDYCVKATIQNMLKADIYPSIFLEGIVSTTDNCGLVQFANDNSLKII